jgi:hypothetical protein
MVLQAHQTIDARYYIAAEVLRDGSIVQIRAIRPDDKERLLEHFAGLGRAQPLFPVFRLQAGPHQR